MMSFPYFLWAIMGITLLGPSMTNAVIAVGVSNIPQYIRIARSPTLSARNTAFVESARAIGATELRIMTRHVFPQIISPLLVFTSLNMASVVLALAALGYLGLGAQPPTPEWGVMLSRARVYMLSAPHLVVFPGFAIAALVLALNLIGDGLRDALDPRLRRWQ